MKKLLIVIGVIIVLLVVIAAALPFLIDVNRFKPELEADLSTALGRKVQIGNIGLSLFSGSVKVDNVSIADDPAFGGAPFLQAKQLAAGVAIQPLIFSKKLEGLGAEHYIDQGHGGHQAGYFEKKFYGPEGILFDIAEQGWAGAEALPEPVKQAAE